MLPPLPPVSAYPEIYQPPSLPPAVIPPVPAPAEQPKKLTCCQRITEIFQKIINTIRSWFCRKSTAIVLTEKEKQCLAALPKNDLLTRYPPNIEPPPAGNNAGLNALLADFNPEAGQTHKAHMQATRKHLVQFTQDLTSIVGELLYENYLEGHLKKLKDNAPDYVQSIRNGAIFIMPVFGRRSEIIKNLSAHRTYCPLDDSLKKSLEWLMQNSSRQQLEERLNASPAICNLSLPPNQQITEYLRLTLDWFFAVQQNPNASHNGLHAMFDPHKHDEQVRDTVREVVVSLLFEFKIEESAQQLQKMLQDKLPDLVRAMIKTNGSKIATTLSNRVTDLLEEVKFPGMIDKIFSQFNAQSNAYLAADEVSRSLLEKAKNARAAKAANRPIDPALEPTIEILEKSGEDACKKVLFASRFKQHTESCHPLIKELIDKAGQQPIDFPRFRYELQRSFYPQLAENLLSLILPAETVLMPNGQTTEISGIAKLWNQLIIPDEIKELIKNLSHFSKSALLPDIFQPLTECQNPITNAVEKYVLSEVQYTVKSFLAGALQRQIEYLAMPNSLNELAAFSIFPSLKDVLFYAYVSNVLWDKAEDFGPHFYSLHRNINDQEANRKMILDKLFAIMATQFSQFSMKEAEITRDYFNILILPLVIEIQKFFIHAETKLATFESKKAPAVLQQYFEVQNSKIDKNTHALYGTLFDTLAFKLGRFGGFAEWLTNNITVVKQLITSTLVTALDVIRLSHENVTVLTCDTIRRSYLSKRTMKKAMFEQPDAPTPVAATNAKLQNNIRHISTLAYDLILRSAKQQGGGALNFLVSKFLGSDATAFNKLITDVYQKSFGDPLLNYNMLLQMQTIIERALKSANEDLIDKRAKLAAAQLSPLLSPRRMAVVSPPPIIPALPLPLS